MRAEVLLQEAADLNMVGSKRGKTLGMGLAVTSTGILWTVYNCLQAQMAGLLQLPFLITWALGFLVSLCAILKKEHGQEG